ncbi:MAG: LytR/AlgR family response regulator transcription factor [Pseudobdellovibrionaceae bacterium]
MYTCIYTEDTEFISELSLTYLEERLAPEKFLRCHRNNIVCLERIVRIGTGTNMTVYVACGVELPVSRQNRQLLLERMKS